MPFKKKYFAVLFFLLVLILFQLKVPDTERVFRGIVGNVVNPVIYYTEKTVTFFTKIYDNYIYLAEVKKKNIRLRERINQLSLENSLLKERLSEYGRLKKLLNFKQAYDFETIAGNVIGRNIDGFLKYIIIDLGKKNDIKINDPVISYDGLVGKVVNVYRNSARVSVILNVNSYVSVMNFNTRTVGIMGGDGKGGLVVDYYDKLDKVSDGDLFITSGLGGLYPKGIPVGKFVKSESSVNGIFQKIYLEQKVNFYKLENVLIIK